MVVRVGVRDLILAPGNVLPRLGDGIALTVGNKLVWAGEGMGLPARHIEVVGER